MNLIIHSCPVQNPHNLSGEAPGDNQSVTFNLVAFYLSLKVSRPRAPLLGIKESWIWKGELSFDPFHHAVRKAVHGVEMSMIVYSEDHLFASL